MTEGRPAGAFWADKIVTQGGVLVLREGGGPPSPLAGAPESQGTEGGAGGTLTAC